MLRRKLAGRIAKKSGDRFERIFYNSAISNGLGCIQIPNGMKVVKLKNKLIPVPIATAFDFLIASNGKILCLDTKSTQKNTFSFSEITPHQLQALEHMNSHGIDGGYIIVFNSQTTAGVYYFPTETLSNVKPKSGLNASMGLHLGSMMDFDLKILFQIS